MMKCRFYSSFPFTFDLPRITSALSAPTKSLKCMITIPFISVCNILTATTPTREETDAALPSLFFFFKQQRKLLHIIIYSPVDNCNGSGAQGSNYAMWVFSHAQDEELMIMHIAKWMLTFLTVENWEINKIDWSRVLISMGRWGRRTFQRLYCNELLRRKSLWKVFNFILLKKNWSCFTFQPVSKLLILTIWAFSCWNLSIEALSCRYLEPSLKLKLKARQKRKLPFWCQKKVKRKHVFMFTANIIVTFSFCRSSTSTNWCVNSCCDVISVAVHKSRRQITNFFTCLPAKNCNELMMKIDFPHRLHTKRLSSYAHALR